MWGPVLAARITYLRRIISPSNSVRKCLIDILETLIIRGTFSIKAATGTIPGVVKSAQTLRFLDQIYTHLQFFIYFFLLKHT